MKKNSLDPLKPKVYLSSKSHPDYLKQEWEYVGAQYQRKLQKKGRVAYLPYLPGLTDPASLLTFYRNELEQAKVNDEGKDQYVFKAVKLFREHPLELTVSLNPLRFSGEAERLGAAVCRVLGRLGRSGVKGDYDTRKKARKRLENIVKGILPDARGKKKNTADPLEIQQFYWKELFRLYHIQNALRASGKNPSQKVKAASQNFDMPIAQIRDLWKLDEDDQTTVRPIPIKEMARILTDQHYGITQHRLSNIMAS